MKRYITILCIVVQKTDFYIKTNVFLYLVQCLSKSFFDLPDRLIYIVILKLCLEVENYFFNALLLEARFWASNFIFIFISRLTEHL